MDSLADGRRLARRVLRYQICCLTRVVGAARAIVAGRPGSRESLRCPAAPAPFKPEVLTDEQVRSEAVARNLERLAWLMDRAIPIPGTNLRVGLDAIIGLLPGGGDFVAGLIQTGLVLTAVHHYRVPKAVAARMAANVLLDTAVGAIPFVGDAFDAVFKANTRNMKLLGEVRDLREGRQAGPTGASVRYLVGIAVVLVGMLGLVLVGFVAVVVWLVTKALSH